jgi:hypothetical protein
MAPLTVATEPAEPTQLGAGASGRCEGFADLRYQFSGKSALAECAVDEGERPSIVAVDCVGHGSCFRWSRRGQSHRATLFAAQQAPIGASDRRLGWPDAEAIGARIGPAPRTGIG